MIIPHSEREQSVTALYTFSWILYYLWMGYAAHSYIYLTHLLICILHFNSLGYFMGKTGY